MGLEHGALWSFESVPAGINGWDWIIILGRGPPYKPVIFGDCITVFLSFFFFWAEHWRWRCLFHMFGIISNPVCISLETRP